MNPMRIARMWQIYRVVHKYGLGEFMGRKARPHKLPPGERLRLALEELGPVFVKFGQALSTPPDTVPRKGCKAWQKLRARLPPFPGPEPRAIVEKALGKPVTEVFAEFDEVPLAAASVAQVPTARLLPDRKS